MKVVIKIRGCDVTVSWTVVLYIDNVDIDGCEFVILFMFEFSLENNLSSQLYIFLASFQLKINFTKSFYPPNVCTKLNNKFNYLQKRNNINFIELLIC